jgi:hypothetical protein
MERALLNASHESFASLASARNRVAKTAESPRCRRVTEGAPEAASIDIPADSEQKLSLAQRHTITNNPAAMTIPPEHTTTQDRALP